MLTAADKKRIAAILRIPEASLETAIAAPEETPLTGIPEGLTALTPTELTDRDTNQRREGKRDGVNDGKEIAIKELKQKAGLTFEGKDPDTFLTELRKKEGATPDAKVQELTQQVTLLTNDKSQLTNQVQQLTQQISSVAQERTLVSNFPKIKAGLPLGQDDILTLVKNSLKIEGEGDDQTISYNGQVLRDGTTQKPLPLKNALEHVFKERGWADDGTPAAGGGGGRGGSSSGTGGGGAAGAPKTRSEAEKAWVEQGKSLNDTPGYAAYLQGLKKDDESFDLTK